MLILAGCDSRATVACYYHVRSDPLIVRATAAVHSILEATLGIVRGLPAAGAQ